MLIAKEKIGKSILAMQMGCNISSGTPFLDLFDVPYAMPVWYFAAEGKDRDMKQRLFNMSKAVTVNKDNFFVEFRSKCSPQISD